MRPRLIYILFSTLLLVSCSDRKDASPKDVDTKSFTSDTTIINDILFRYRSGQFDASDSSLHFLSLARELAEKNDYPEGVAAVAYETGIELYRKNKFAKALLLFDEVVHLAEEQGDILLKARCLERMGSVSLDLGDDNKAMKLYYEALPLFEQTGNKRGIADVYNIIGGNKSVLKEFTSAERYLRKAIKLNEEIGNLAGIIHNKANLAFMYHYMGKDTDAKALYTELIPELIEFKDSLNLSTVYSHLSLFFQWTHQPDSSLIYLRKAASLSEKLSDISMLPTLYGMLGMEYLNAQKYDSASFYLSKSVDQSRLLNDYFTIRQALKLLLSMDTLTGNFKNATLRYREILAMNDSIFGQKIRNSIESSELRYENQKKNNLIDVQKLKLESTGKQKRNLIILLLLSVLLSMTLVMLILIIRRSNLRKNQLLTEELKMKALLLENASKAEEINKLQIGNAEKELKIKEREQLSHSLALLQKNELLGLISSRISQVTKNVDSINSSDLKEILSSIRMQLKQDDESDMFNQKFSLLHPDFFDRIKQQHPDLTKSELKFCAYLRLNLNGNQIANILSVTSEAIRKSRHRIRKKFNLESDESLESYISTF